ncbi:sensor histidine kinase [Pedobacter changchengzhani]|uniref:Sensor histidine kinase n=1 Tax=Pedobacter changchengzhani TaxID=2529274 RepID=A0A4R5MIV9_9SPHI|nr:histidine kinase [Pedobacter changchengzhani]TDG35490.1 sensor histidine kinase [Pedobacter changchengzhani]
MENNNKKNINHLEFWISTTLYILALINICVRTAYSQPNVYSFVDVHIGYSVIANYFLPNLFKSSSIYISFLLINFCFIPQILKKNNLALNVILLVIVTAISILTWMVAITYSEAYRLLDYPNLSSAYDAFFGEAFGYVFLLYLLFCTYTYLNENGLSLLGKSYLLKNYSPNIVSELFIATKIWLVSLMIFGTILSARFDTEVLVVWLIAPPINIALAFYSIYFTIPNLKKKGKGFGKYFWTNVGLSTVSILILLFILATFMGGGPTVPITLILTSVVLVCITTPFAWYIYKHKFEKQTEIQMLKTELGKSDANLNFLKSQINPHFLFNALNTLFGTALQENAERTGEGIQKLGDMMRFMLHENTLDKISLAREVEYLNNYIDLQKLRISRSGDIKIETTIDDQVNNLQITPMLLIPFIENAFKHGISLQQPSHIKITLQTTNNILHFDVSNSIYIKADNDPEKLKSGIGLQNVKQRLALLYYGKHELIIHENAKEFFVHLTLELD